MAILSKVLLNKITIGVLGLAGTFEGYNLFKPPEDSLGFMRRKVAEQVCSKAVGDLPAKPGVRNVAVAAIQGDETGFVTAQLRDRIGASGKYEVIEQSFFQKLLREFGREEAPVLTLADAVALGRKLGVDAVIFGTIPEYALKEQGATVRLELRMAERESGNAIFAKSYMENLGGGLASPSHWRARMADSSKGRRIFVWVCFALLLPLITAPLIRRIAAEESNAFNLAMLVAYTLVDILIAFALTGFWIPTLWTAGILLLALAASAYYNYRIATVIEELAH
jgi:hypothetical protein